MGRIRTDNIKSMSDKLLEVEPDKFGTEFDKNKEVVDGMIDISSKKTRNIIAGYITHLLEKKERLNTLKVTYQPPPPDRRRGRGRR
jgi:small subunit ribosomal protein S17e